MPADGSEWYLESASAKHPKHPKKKYLISAVAACLVLCFLSAFLFQLMPSASVYLDVNPSVMLKVNNRNRVTQATACNGDAVRILGDLDFRGADLDVALYAILGSMVHNGYLTESKDTVLVSVQCANTARANNLESKVTDVVSRDLKDMINAGEVLSHRVGANEAEKDNAEEQFSPGKTSFIKDLTEKYPQLDGDDLEDLTIDEIVSVLKGEDLDYSDYRRQNDDDEDHEDSDDGDSDEDHDEEDDGDDITEDNDEEDDD